jgi:predicted ATPase
MISEITISDPTNTCIPWWEKVVSLQGKTSIQFKPGLNILWGGNGSGKSTLIKCIARMLHSEQGGKTTVTGHSIREIIKYKDRKNTYLNGAYPIHDGQSVIYFDPDNLIGLIGGQFDDDFFMEGIANNFKERMSTGQKNMERMLGAFATIYKQTTPPIEWKTAKNPEIELYLQGTLEKGQPTVLLDEPERSLSLKHQYGMWRNLALRGSKQTQIIAASHSVFALDLPGAHYIEMTPGDLLESQTILQIFKANPNRNPHP